MTIPEFEDELEVDEVLDNITWGLCGRKPRPPSRAQSDLGRAGRQKKVLWQQSV